MIDHTQYNIIHKLGKYKFNPVAEEFVKHVEIVKTPVSWDETQDTEVVVIWNGDKSGDIKHLRVVKIIELEPINDDLRSLPRGRRCKPYIC